MIAGPLLREVLAADPRHPQEVDVEEQLQRDPDQASKTTD